MKIAKLKHYDLYIHRLVMFCKAMDIRVKFHEVDSDGTYIPTRRLIEIDEDLEQPETIAVFLHEIGHLLDMNIVGDFTTSKWEKINKAYDALDRSKASKDQIKAVRAVEGHAWDLGRAMARVLKIRLGKWFDNVEKECLKSYKN